MHKLTFKTVDNQDYKLWIYDEGNPKNDKNRMAMIWIHGGGWYSGDPGYFGDDYDYFTKKGIVCFGVEYRLVSTTENDPMSTMLIGAVEDCVDAVLYVKSNANRFGIDPDNIVVVGESAGGHLALCFATDVLNKFNANATPKAIVAYNPVIETVAKWSTSAGKVEGISFDENTFYERYNLLKRISPSHNIIKSSIPLLLLTGIEDNVVYPGEIVDFYERYKAVGNPAEIVLYPNTTHAFALPFYYDKGMESRDKSLFDIEKFLTIYGLI